MGKWMSVSDLSVLHESVTPSAEDEFMSSLPEPALPELGSGVWRRTHVYWYDESRCVTRIEFVVSNVCANLTFHHFVKSDRPTVVVRDQVQTQTGGK